MTTLLTWLWSQPKARYVYTADDVNVWARMVRHHVPAGTRIACATTMPEGIDADVDILTPPPFMAIDNPSWSSKLGLPQCYRRLTAFAPDAADWIGSERFVWMDMDSVILGDLSWLTSLSEQVDFAMFRGTSGRRPYNGSLVIHRCGTRPQLFERFSERRARRASQEFIGSDQAWISKCLGWGERTVADDEGVYAWSGNFQQWTRRNGRRPPPNASVVFFPGEAKPAELANNHRWIEQARRCEYTA